MNFSKTRPYFKHSPVLSLRGDIIIVFLGPLRSCKVRFYVGSTCCVRGVRLRCDSLEIPRGDTHSFDATLCLGLQSMSVLGPMRKSFILLQMRKPFKFRELFRAGLQVAKFAINLGQQVVWLRGIWVRSDRSQKFNLCSFGIVLASIAFSKQHVHLRHGRLSPLS